MLFTKKKSPQCSSGGALALAYIMQSLTAFVVHIRAIERGLVSCKHKHTQIPTTFLLSHYHTHTYTFAHTTYCQMHTAVIVVVLPYAYCCTCTCHTAAVHYTCMHACVHCNTHIHTPLVRVPVGPQMARREEEQSRASPRRVTPVHVAERSRQTAPEVCSTVPAMLSRTAPRGRQMQPKVRTITIHGWVLNIFLLWVPRGAHITGKARRGIEASPRRWLALCGASAYRSSNENAAKRVVSMRNGSAFRLLFRR